MFGENHCNKNTTLFYNGYFNHCKKKMPILQNFSNSGNDKYIYLPAVLKENKSGWLIEYYVEHPQTKELTRKQIRLTRLVTRYANKRDARQHISKMITSLNNRLAGGWNPFFENEDARMFEKLTTVAELFLKEKTKEQRFNTLRSYKSFIHLFLEFMKKNDPDIICSVFGKSYAVRYMDYFYNERNVGAQTYNNQLKMAIAFFNWAISKNYTKQNPFASIKKKPKENKNRVIIPAGTRQTITDYLRQENNIPFLVICQLIYSSLIRPKELLMIQIKHINLSEKYITIPGTNSKNHKTRYSAITEDIINNIKLLNINDMPEDYYLFGSDLKPNKQAAHQKRAGKEWDKIRKKLHLPDEMQLYSLRDTGIFDMLKSGIDDLSVMQHADHSSLDITTRYANHHDINLINKISSQAPKF